MVANQVQPLGWRALWGKWGYADDSAVADPEVHPLICHMVDVAQVTGAIWDLVLTANVREGMTRRMGLGSQAAGRYWVCLGNGCHDLGKATRAFASKKQRVAESLEQCGLAMRMFATDRQSQPHGIATAVLLPPILQTMGLDARLASRVATAVGGHHGSFAAVFEERCVSRSERENPEWGATRAELVRVLATTLGASSEGPPKQFDDTVALFVAGLASVADWIGSNTDFFPYQTRLSRLGREPADMNQYAEQARVQAQEALHELGWVARQHLSRPGPAQSNPEDARREFKRLFAVPDLRPIQADVLEITPQLAGGGLVIIEAPMGEGKTEAGLHVAHQWLKSGNARGVYVALPTEATSNQMFGRVRTFLAGAFPGSGVDLQLLHGHAALSAEFERLKQAGRTFDVKNIHDESAAASRPDVVASEWFTYRKRGLLAPFGVGTVDQALLGVLSTPHVFVRLFGLADKVVIIDEVHAYDVYTSALVERLLHWLGSLGSSVILLSATLPARKRRALSRAYARGRGWAEEASDREAEYPRLTWLGEAASGCTSVQTSAGGRKKVRLRWVSGRRPANKGDRYPLGEALKEALRDGGCAAVICNTVASAQQTYRALRAVFADHDPETGHSTVGLATDGEPLVDLFHARYPFQERRKREQRALRRFGKPGASVIGGKGEELTVERPGMAILVATQVVEQSLDLDFDLIVSEFAPLDLLLQRIGRLHRHQRNDRPLTVRTPMLWLIEPAIEENVPRFDPGSRAVYHPHVLLRSWLVLQSMSWKDGELTLAIPECVSDLVEGVYGDRLTQPEDPRLLDEWTRSYASLTEEAGKLAGQADLRILGEPGTEDLSNYTEKVLAEDAPEFHQRFQALTRWGPPTASTVLLYEQPGGFSLDPAGSDPVDPRHRPSGTAEITAILERSVPLSSRGLAPRLLKEPAPVGWQKVALLRPCRYLVLNQRGEGEQHGFRIKLDPDEGLLISSGEVHGSQEERE